MHAAYTHHAVSENGTAHRVTIVRPDGKVLHLELTGDRLYYSGDAPRDDLLDVLHTLPGGLAWEFSARPRYPTTTAIH
ncbi:hypothetical protein LCGC14_0335040 [marine sediment metagenome]|uniref:Uncharacterized protein n=1 Tax=marine sediment metagenome TaxID=412755 RepID=A0A0F9W2W1_9ZZZZ